MLAEEWPGAEIIAVENAGHAMSEPGIRVAVVEALDRVADRANV